MPWGKGRSREPLAGESYCSGKTEVDLAQERAAEVVGSVWILVIC